jgi:hypothetical protein
LKSSVDNPKFDLPQNQSKFDSSFIDQTIPLQMLSESDSHISGRDMDRNFMAERKRIPFVNFPPHFAESYIKTGSSSVDGSEEAKYNLMLATLNLVLNLVSMIYNSLQLYTILISDIYNSFNISMVLTIGLKLPKI